MPIFRVTWNYKNSSDGWSETLWNDEQDHDAAYMQAKRYLSLRMPLMGIGVECTGIRVSDEAILGDGDVDKKYRIALWDMPANPDDGSEYYKIVGNYSADLSWTALHVNWYKTGGMRIGYTNMRGLPDTFFSTPKHFAPTVKWKTEFEKWLSEVADGWSIRGFSKVAPADKKRIEKVTALGTEPVKIQAPNHGLVANDRVYIGKVLTERGMWFGDFVVREAISLHEFTLQDTLFLKFDYKKGGYVRKKNFTQHDIKYGKMQGPGKRNPGRPSDTPVGRRSRRVSIQ